MEKLVQYFMENLIIDFDGDLDIEQMRQLLDDSPASMKLIEKLQTNDDLNEFFLTMSDALREYIGTGITPEVLHREFEDYAES